MPLPTTTPAHRTTGHDADRIPASPTTTSPTTTSTTASTTSATPTTPTTLPSATPPAPCSTPRSCGPAAWPPPPSPPLVGLVGTLVIRVLFEYAPVGTAAAHAFSTTNAGLLCLFAGVAALAATGVAHLLIVSTPDPLSYLGWIIGLSTAAAVVLPLLGGVPLAAAIAIAVVNLVIGLAIGSLVIGTAMAARRPATR